MRKHASVVVCALLFMVATAVMENYCNAPDVFVALPPADFLAQHDLQGIQVIHRHGDRAPANRFHIDDSYQWNCSLTGIELYSDNMQPQMPSPPFLFRKKYIRGKSQLPGDCLVGQLTSKGKDQHVEIGKKIRSFLDSAQFKSLSFENLHIRSTDLPRTQHSVIGEVFGLLGDKNGKDLPVPNIFTRAMMYENMISNPIECPAFTNAINAIKESGWYKAMLQKHSYAQGLIDRFYPGNDNLFQVFDHSQCRRCHGGPLLPNLNENDTNAVIAYANDLFAAAFNSTDVIKYGIGLFVGDLMEDYQALTKSHKGYVNYYSGHDTTLWPLVRAFGFLTSEWPPYASHMILEQWQPKSSAGESYARLHYNGKLLTVPGCTEPGPCPNSAFFPAIAKMIPSQSECEMK